VGRYVDRDDHEAEPTEEEAEAFQGICHFHFRVTGLTCR
jgi:hypothetical protein